MTAPAAQLEFQFVLARQTAGLRAAIIDSLAGTFRGFWPEAPAVKCEICGAPAASILQPVPARDGEHLAAVIFSAACRNPNCGWSYHERFTAAQLAEEDEAP